MNKTKVSQYSGEYLIFGFIASSDNVQLPFCPVNEKNIF